MQNMERLEKIMIRKEILEKKQKLWGLTEKEEKELQILKIEYIQNYYRLIDNIFVEYIEPLLMNNQIIELKLEILSKSGWEGELIFEDSEMEELLNNINNKDEVLELIEVLKRKEMTEALLNIDNFKGEIINLFKEMNGDDIIGYIKIRYDIMLDIIGGEYE